MILVAWKEERDEAWSPVPVTEGREGVNVPWEGLLLWQQSYPLPLGRSSYARAGERTQASRL